MKASTLRTATTTDFKVGTTLIMGNIEYTIIKHYTEGVWEAKTRSGICCVFEGEARFYQVIDNA